jgi:mitochondrial fission process protein 1
MTNNNSTDRSEESSSANEPDHQEDDRTNNHNNNKNEETKNIFRDTSLRYLGYANEVGESFRYQYPRGVGPSYWIAAGYCCADAGWSGYNSYCQNRNRNSNSNISISYDDQTNATKTSSSSSSSSAVVVAGTVVMDTLVWQLLASVLIPGATINGIVRIAKFAVHSLTTTNHKNNTTTTRPSSSSAMLFFFHKWTPTTIGLLSIPLIVHPIDQAVDYFMDETIRPYFNSSSSSSPTSKSNTNNNSVQQPREE